MSTYDLLRVTNSTVTLPSGSQLGNGNYTARGLNNISASYMLTGNTITVLDDGDCDDLTDEQMLIEAPTHASIVNGNFHGQIRLDDCVLHVENNQVVSTSC